MGNLRPPAPMGEPASEHRSTYGRLRGRLLTGRNFSRARQSRHGRRLPRTAAERARMRLAGTRVAIRADQSRPSFTFADQSPALSVFGPCGGIRPMSHACAHAGFGVLQPAVFRALRVVGKVDSNPVSPTTFSASPFIAAFRKDRQGAAGRLDHTGVVRPGKLKNAGVDVRQHQPCARKAGRDKRPATRIVPKRQWHAMFHMKH